MTRDEEREKIRALVKRMEERRGKSRLWQSEQDAAQAEWERVWPHVMPLPYTQFADRTKKILWKIKLRQVSPETADPISAEAIEWVRAQGFPFATRGDRIGFLEADHAFAFKMRWG